MWATNFASTFCAALLFSTSFDSQHCNLVAPKSRDLHSGSQTCAVFLVSEARCIAIFLQTCLSLISQKIFLRHAKRLRKSRYLPFRFYPCRDILRKTFSHHCHCICCWWAGWLFENLVALFFRFSKILNLWLRSRNRRDSIPVLPVVSGNNLSHHRHTNFSDKIAFRSELFTGSMMMSTGHTNCWHRRNLASTCQFKWSETLNNFRPRAADWRLERNLVSCLHVFEVLSSAPSGDPETLKNQNKFEQQIWQNIFLFPVNHPQRSRGSTWTCMLPRFSVTINFEHADDRHFRKRSTTLRPACLQVILATNFAATILYNQLHPVLDDFGAHFSGLHTISKNHVFEITDVAKSATCSLETELVRWIEVASWQKYMP